MGCYEFLKQIAPFSSLPEAEIKKICDFTKKADYRKGEFIFTAGDENLEALVVIEKGLVELNVKKGERQIIIGYRGEGEFVGEDVYFSKKPYSYNAYCVENTTVYIIPKEILDKVSDSYPVIYAHIAKLLTKRLELLSKEAEEITEAKRAPAFFKRKVGEALKRKDVVFVEPETHVEDIARIMDEKDIEAVVVKDDGAVGIISEKDIVRRFIARKMGDTASRIMTPNPIKVGLQELCYKAAVNMVRNKIRHVLVEDNGRIVGMLEILDLLEDETLMFINLFEGIASSKDIDTLSRQASKVEGLVEFLLDTDFSAEEICEIITELNDEIFRRTIRLTMDEIGEAPVKFSFLVFGSHGRKEQTLKTDQDNAIIYDGEGEEVESWMNLFSEKVVENLVKVGFPRCPGDMMVSNPYWRGNLSQWKDRMYHLFLNPVPEKILRFSVFYDHRTIWGDLFFEDELRKIIYQGIKDHPGFLARFAKIAAERKPPIGLFGRFIVEKSGEHKNELDIKGRGCLPITECVKVLALLHRIDKTNTFERIRELKNKGVLSKELAEEALFSYDFLLKLRIRNHVRLYKEGAELHNYINPEHLSSVERKLLKESFAVIYKLQREVINKAEAVYVV
ncbi:MAG: cyclic nucleotide-binding/CBS domain-containing protein [Deferribacteres bacterium]|nr:cyclic nucleotide-binding/CBS domain-containing protein [Deferribacteres bacterium]